MKLKIIFLQVGDLKCERFTVFQTVQNEQSCPPLLAINDPVNNDLTLLQNAASRGDVQEVIFLVRKCNAFVDALGNRDGNTALHEAAYNGHANIVTFLLQNRADPNLVKFDGVGAIHLALVTKNPAGSVPVLKALLNGGANINLPNIEGLTALQLARSFGNQDAVIFLENFITSPVDTPGSAGTSKHL